MDKQKQIINFLKYLSLHGVSPKSLKYYKSDFISFLNWAGNKKINQSLILEYINSIRAVTPISTLKRRQSTLRSYASFMGFKKVSNTWQESILSAFTKKPRLQNFFHKLFFSRPNWYRTYHSYQLATYIHVAILVLFTSIAGFAVYDQIFNTKNNLLAFPTALTRPNRYLSFQGRLTSNVGNPITTATNLVFKLYTASTAGSELWTSGTCSITPDQDGIFSTLLGTTTNCPTATEIAATVFSENASVWVGVTVAADAEATPRVQIATVAYALNSETLQGYPAGTGTSTIPYIASTGTLVLANASPKIQSTSGTFAVEGLAMTITTPNASNGVITVNPDGVGTLDLTFEGAAAGLSANGFVNATNANITSGALYGGTVASAATGYNFIDFQSGVTPASVFSVQNDGDIVTAGDLTLSGGNLNTGNIALTIGDATTDTITLTTDGTGNGEVVLPNDSIGPNEILSTGQTDEYCLTYEGTGTTWEWQSCAAAGGGSWSALTVPTANLSLAHAGYTTAFTFNSVTTADAFALSSSSLTTGTILDLSSTSTAGGASGSSKILDITRSGTNSNASHTAYGLYSAVTNTGTTSTNVGGYFSASGATNNYGLIVENGSVGIGTATPTYRLDVRGASTGIGFDVSDAYPVIIPTLNATVEDIKFSSLGNGGNLYLSAPGTDATNSYIDFATAGSSKMRILNSGKVQIGTASETHTLDTGDVLVSSDLELDGVLYLDGGTISNSAGTASLVLSATPTTTANSLSAGNWLIENTANVGQAALIVNQTKSGDLFTASASGVTKFTIANTGAITSAIGNWTSQVADSSTAIGFTFNTSNTLSTQGSKLLSFQNLGSEKMYLDKDGNLYVSGTLLSGNGTSMLLTNKSGGVVANRALVILDSSNNSSFTTTTTPYNKAGFGVVVGVGLGVTNDADGDGSCDANDICMVAYGGEVEVTVKNASTAVKGDYLFTSDTAGSAIASAKQYDGLVGAVSNIAGAGSGYVKMIFKVQPQVTAAAAIDKTTKHNEYWLYADNYKAVGEGANTDTNLLQRGLAFDTFTDSTKTDSANTTASLDTNTQRTGLIGGQTMATSTTDNDGQTYLGSNTVNDQYYYDRTKDSSPQVQVELGIDPNWYNGVTLSVATTSAQFSQNSTIWPPAPRSLGEVGNPNLSTNYNGSLVKVTGTDATPRTIYITIKSPTTFDWTNYQGDSATGVIITPGTAQTLGDTGVSATFTNARYNTGDVFKIASWFIEAESATRGAKQQFPERSNVIATASSIDIIDADTQKLWMRFSQGTSYAIGVDANNDPSSANMLNGKAYISTNGSSATGLYTLDFAHDAAFKQNATDYRLSDTALYGRNAANTYNVINTSNILVNITANDVSAAVIPNQPTQEVTVSGWGYIAGNASASNSETVNLPYKFNDIPKVNVSYAGLVNTTAPNSLANCTTFAGYTAKSSTITTSSFTAIGISENNSDVYGATSYLCYTWTATGQVSPRQYVAVATGASGADGGTSIINETDGSVANVVVGSHNASALRSYKVAFAQDGTLYIASSNETSGNSRIDTYYGAAGLSSETSWAQYINRDYYVNSGYPSILGPAGAGTITSLNVTSGTSTADGKSNTIYIGTTGGITVLQEKQSHANMYDEDQYFDGSVKYYTKDYISEEMVGDIRGMWPLSANGALSMSDASVKASTLTNNGTATAITGVRGMGVSLNGTTQYLSRADDTNFEGMANASWGSWVKTSDTSGSIINKEDGNAQRSWALLTSGGTNYCQVSGDGSTAISASSTSPVITDNNWHHVICTYTGSSSINMYIDGILTATTTTSVPATIYNSTSQIRIGERTTNSFMLAGTIDEPFFTATTLTAGQIKNMYQVGYRALQSHGTTLGGGAADTNQQLGGTTNTIGAVAPDYNNQFMYVGTNSTTLGAVSKIDLNSDTNIKTYNSSANVPTGGALLIDEDTKSLAVGYNLEAVGSAASGVKTMGVDNNATATSGNFIGKTITTAESFTQAYLWAQYTLDASDASNTIEVWASNDGGSNYSQCNLTNTDTSRSPSEYEYFCQFNTAGSSLKTKFVMARGSTKTNTWVSKYGIAWIDSNAVAGSANGSGLFTGTNASVANGSYIDVAHNQNSNDLVTNGWVYNTGTSKWEQVDVTSNEQATNSAQVNFNTEANYTQENMAYAVTLTPSATSGDITLTLGSGTWSSDARIKAGTRVVGNGGIATITGTPAAQTTITATVTTAFTNTNAIASGSWYLYGTTFDGSVAKLNTYNDSPDSYTKSLLHTDGTDASTTFTDEIGKTWTRTSNAEIDTAQSKFGGASGLFAASGISTADHDDFYLSTGDFSFDFWFRSNGSGYTFQQQTDANNRQEIYVGQGSPGDLTYRSMQGGSWHVLMNATPVISANTWYHVYFGRSGNSGYIALDGTMLSITGGDLTGKNLANFAASATVGTAFTGWLDEFRFSKGIARWTANFTPPTSAYNQNSAPTSQNYSVVTNSDQLATASWDHVDSVAVTETLNSQTINYSVSFDGKTTFYIYDSTTSNNGWRPIARNNSGTWQYNSNTTAGVSNVTWTSATYNSQNGAISQAAGVTQNQMTGTTLNAVTALQWREINGFTPTTNTIDFAAALKTTSAAQIPQVDQIKVNYTQAGMKIVQTDANTVRLYNYSGATQNLRLDVITGGLGRNAGTVSLAPAAADVDSAASTNSIWINKTGSGGNLLKLQKSGTDILNVSQNGGNAAVILNQTLSGDILSASASGTPKFTVTNGGNIDISGIVFSAGGPKYFPIMYEGSAQTNDTFFNGFTFGKTVTITGVTLSAKTAPTGSALTVDLIKNGSAQSLTSTLADGVNSQFTNLTDTNYAAADTFGLKITGVGSTEAGRDLTVIVHYTEASGGDQVNYISIPYEGTAVNNDIVIDGVYLDSPITIKKVSISARNAPTGANLTVDLTKSGSVQSRTATLTAASTFETTDITDTGISPGERLGVKVTGVGSTVAGESLQIILQYTHDRGDTGTQYLPLLYYGLAQNSDDIVNGFTPNEKLTVAKASLFVRDAPTGANLTVDLLKNDTVQSRTMTLHDGYTYQANNIKDDPYTTSDTLGMRITGIGSTFEGESVLVMLHTANISTFASSFMSAFEGPLTIGTGDYNTLTSFVPADGSLYVSGSLGVSGVAYLEGGTAWTSADIAEAYPTLDSTIEAGDIVTIATDSVRPVNQTNPNDSPAYVAKTTLAYDKNILGVISTKPAGVMGMDRSASSSAEIKVPVALIGRVPVKIASSSATIKPGDFITSSDVPGRGQLATDTGMTVGKALEEWQPDGNKDTIMVAINTTTYTPNLYLTDTGDLRIDINPDPLAGNENQYQLTNGQVLINRIGAYAQLVAANIRAGLIESDVIKTSLISPIANTDLIIDLQPDNASESARLVIKGKDDEIVTSFDAEGNATISGTLYANNIESQRLEDIEELLREVETNQTLLTEASLWNTDTATASGQFTDLFVTGQTAMTSLFVSDNFTTKNINSLTEPLSIQSLASAPLEIMAGKIIIDTDGNTKFLGNVEIAGDLTINNIIVANNIDPIATESGSIIEGEINSNATAGKAVLTANTEKIRINNNKVSLNTLIYITPITSTQNKVLYVKTKGEGFFDIGFSDTLDTDVEFNWWIIELEPILDVTNLKIEGNP